MNQKKDKLIRVIGYSLLGISLILFVISAIPSSSNPSSSYNNTSGCQFKYPDGRICGNAVGSHSPLCDYHFKQLNDTYNSITGGR